MRILQILSEKLLFIEKITVIIDKKNHIRTMNGIIKFNF